MEAVGERRIKSEARMVDTEIFVAEPELSSNQVGWQLQITDLPGSNSVLTDAK